MMIKSLLLSVCMCCMCHPITQQATETCFGSNCLTEQATKTYAEIALPINFTEVIVKNLPVIADSLDVILHVLNKQVDKQRKMVTILKKGAEPDVPRTIESDGMDIEEVNTDSGEMEYEFEDEEISTDAPPIPPIGKARDCTDIAEQGFSISGIYNITPGNLGDDLGTFSVYCDIDSNGKGWTVFQRRLDGSVDFYRNFHDYENGFGDLDGEHWLGLRKIHRLTTFRYVELLVELEDFSGNSAYDHYSQFRVGDAPSRCQVFVYTDYDGTAGNGMSDASGMGFTTKDDNNCLIARDCAVMARGAWWYGIGWANNPNGLYLGPSQINETGITWWTWKRSYEVLKRTQFKFHRKLSDNWSDNCYFFMMHACVGWAHGLRLYEIILSSCSIMNTLIYHSRHALLMRN